MADDTFTASDFTSAETTLSSDPAPASAAPVESSAPDAAAAQLGGATTQPVAEQADSTSTDPAQAAGPIPFPVHKTALENARTKAAQEAQAQFDAQYGWAKAVNPQEFQQIQRIAAKFSGGDPINGLQDLIAEIRKDPQYDAQLKSLAARALSQRGPAAPAEPQMVQVQLEDGSVVNMPRDPQAWLAHQQQQWMTQMEQRLQPLQKTHETLQAERQAIAQQQQVDHLVGTTFQEVTTLPGMEAPAGWRPGMDTPENWKAIAAELAKANIDPNDPRDVMLATHAAYHKVVLPNLHKASRQAVLNDINRQAAASTVNPAHTSTRAPKSMDDMSIAEALQFVAAQAR